MSVTELSSQLLIFINSLSLLLAKPKKKPKFHNTQNRWLESLDIEHVWFFIAFAFRIYVLFFIALLWTIMMIVVYQPDHSLKKSCEWNQLLSTIGYRPSSIRLTKYPDHSNVSVVINFVLCYRFMWVWTYKTTGSLCQ